MKKILICFVFLVCVSKTNSQTNVYHPFPLDSATWRFDYSNSTCNGYCFTYDNVMKGDTTINLHSYKRYGSNQGAIRQDISLKKIYYYNYNPSSESLLYDFNLSVGDTIPHTWYGNSDTASLVTVQSIDSIIINGQNRNKFILHNQSFSSQIELIEGVGNTFGILSPFIPCICGVDLVCFKGDGILQLSHLSGHSNCDNLVGINEKTKEENFFISPNPTTGEFAITLSKDNAEITISNILGQQIIKTHAPQKTMTFQLDNNGVYTVSVTTQQGISMRKLIVNR